MKQRNTSICAYHRHRRQRMKVRLDQRIRELGRYSGRRLCQWCADIAQDSRVDAIREADVTEVGVGADPVVIDSLVGGELKRKFRRRSMQLSSNKHTTKE